MLTEDDRLVLEEEELLVLALFACPRVFATNNNSSLESIGIFSRLSAATKGSITSFNFSESP